MYTELFKLRELPFRLSPDPEFLYLSKNHSRAKAYMESTIWFTDGFVVITGEIGSGKTTLIETFLRELEKDVVVAQINQTQVSAVEFLQAVLVQFGFSPFKMKKAELIATLNSFLIEQYAAGRKVLLIIDEAQNLSLRTLEEVRMLSGVETTKDKVLRIILAGQPELNDKLDSPELVQLAQRVRLRFHLTALSREDTRGLHPASPGSGRLRRPRDLRGRLLRPDLPLHRRRAAPREHAVRNRDDGGLHRRSRPCAGRGRARRPSRNWHGRSSRALKQVARVAFVRFTLGHRQHRYILHGTLRHGGRAAVQDFTWASDDTSSQRSRADTPLAKLIVVTDGRTVGELPLRSGRTIIGRTPDNDLQIDSRFVSRHHCQIITKPNACVVEDLNSTNGIVVKSKRVRRHNLNDGDVITIGRHDLIYVDERAGSRNGHSGGHSAGTADNPPPLSETQDL